MAIIEGAANGGGIVKLPGVGAIIQEVPILPSSKSAARMFTFSSPAAGTWQQISQPKVGYLHFFYTKVRDLGSWCCGYRYPRRLRRCRGCRTRKARVSAFDGGVDAKNMGFSSGYSPDPYILGAEQCGAKPERCLVVEDSPNGIRSGKAAGCRTLALLTTHSPQQVAETSPDYTVKDLSR